MNSVTWERLWRRAGVFSRSSKRMVLSAIIAATFLGAACSPGSAAPELGDIEDATIARGAAVYAQQCQVCHGDAATGDSALAGIPNHGPDGHTWHHADGQLSGIILGELIYPGRTMPSFMGVLTEEDVEAILAFLKSNWTVEQLEFQSEVSSNWNLIN